MRKLLRNVLVGAAAVLGLGGFLVASSAAAQQMTIYMVSHGGPGDPFWNPVIKGAKDAGKALGVRVIYVSPQQQGNVSEVIRHLNSAIAANPAAIGVTVDNANGFSAPLKEAAKDGIPVVAFNTIPNPVSKSVDPYLGYVGQDNYTAGQGVAKEAIQVFGLQSGDRVAIVNHQAGNTSLTSRADGIESILKPKGITVDVLATPGSNPAQSQSVIQSYLSKHPHTKALLTLGPLGYQPAAKVLQSDNLVGKVGLGGMDLNQEGLTLIKNGVMAFTWDQQPYVQGYMTVVELYLKAKYGFNPPAFYNTGVGVINKANVGQWTKLVKEGDD